jgi:hypothetical protein
VEQGIRISTQVGCLLTNMISEAESPSLTINSTICHYR